MSKQHLAEQHSDGFVFVTSTKKQQKSRNFVKRFTKPTASQTINVDKSPVNVELFLRSIEETQFDLKSSEYCLKTFEKVLAVLGNVKVERIICLGLGKIVECPISRHQLAFIRCLQQELGFDGSIEFFDPVFCDQAVDILQRLGSVVLRENYEGKYLADRATLFYLPHCPKQISNNLLWRNWNSKLLRNVYLICNSFSGIIANCPNRFLQQNARYILEVENFCREIPFENTYRHTDIFNDTSLHYFEPSDLQGKPAEFWNSTEPQYTEEDLELITSSIQRGLTIHKNGNNQSCKQRIEDASDRTEGHQP